MSQHGDAEPGDVLEAVERYYSRKVAEHGPTHSGADWSTQESQTLRFEQLLKLCDMSQPFSILDYGCGYGALVDLLSARGCQYEYRGYDISEAMLSHARTRHATRSNCSFSSDKAGVSAADYVVASGIFNVKLAARDDHWHRYVIETLDRFDSLSRKGFAFNALTSYSDIECQRNDLHYADPLAMFDHCKRRYSRFVTLLHDYPLYEFTILVRK
jgi:SAM-dependent methyltransferase